MSTDAPRLPGHTSGLTMLVEWANGQDLWVRKLVGEVIESRRRLSDERIGAIYEFLLKEKRLTDGEPEDVGSLRASSVEGAERTPIRLLKLRHIANVNALARDQEIEFHPRLTICFGENASGKTGYVRILKHAAAVRTSETVLPNIYNPGSSGDPHAEIIVQVGEEQCTLDWRGEHGVEPLTRIDVFDARGAVVHLERDLSYAYTPADLSLFPLVMDGIERVQAKLDEARRERQPGVNAFVHRFDRESNLYAKVEALGPSTNLQELEAAARINQEEEAMLPGLRDKVEVLRSATVRQQIQRAEEEREAYEQVHSIAETIVGFDPEAYGRALAVLRDAREAHERATRQAFSEESVPGILGDAWKEFVEAAEEYIRQTGLDPYPRAGEPCVYCRQPLGDAAVALLQKYRDYCNAELRKAVEEARRSVEALTGPVRKLAVDDAAAGIERLVQATEDPANPPPPLAMARRCIAQARQMQAALAAARECPGLPEELVHAPAVLKAAKESIDQTLADLRKQGAERDLALAEQETRLRDLQARLTLHQLLPEIRSFVEAACWADRVRTLLGRFQTMKRNLTKTAKRASNEVMNRQFQALFEAECAALRAPRVNLDFPGREGEARRRKLLTPEHGLGEILSEGEQKVIALADFLAEASLKPDRSPIVFDDPVTSLDYKRLRHVVNRIVDLSAERQVIVFTHDIWFTAEMLAQFRNGEDGYKAYVIHGDGRAIGEVAAGTPRTDSFTDRKNRIERTIREAESARGEERLALIERGYDELRGACEVVVEKDLLRDVVGRFRPNVKMGNLRRIRGELLQQAIDRVYDIFERCCRHIPSHSQPLSTLGARPTLEDLRRDWEDLREVRKEYLG